MRLRLTAQQDQAYLVRKNDYLNYDISFVDLDRDELSCELFVVNTITEEAITMKLQHQRYERIPGEELSVRLIGGEFNGEMVCKSELLITSKGVVKGKLLYRSLRIESGGSIDATVSKLESKEAKLLPFTQKRNLIESNP